MDETLHVSEGEWPAGVPDGPRVPGNARARAAHASLTDHSKELGRGSHAGPAPRPQPARPYAPRHPPQPLGRALCKSLTDIRNHLFSLVNKSW